jgi:hypothetical protein
MSFPEPQQVTFEICPECTQRTASHFFRTVRKRRLCNLCAHRAEEAAVSLTARTKDANVHGGLGWLWEHIGLTALGAFGGPWVRLGLLFRSFRDDFRN